MIYILTSLIIYSKNMLVEKETGLIKDAPFTFVPKENWHDAPSARTLNQTARLNLAHYSPSGSRD
jgi:hypothetical protein